MMTLTQKSPTKLKTTQRTSKRSAGPTQKRWSGDMKETADRNWLQAAQNKEIWHNLEETYIQKWTREG